MLGIIGGTFDPIHFGHLRPALEIAEYCSLSEVRFIPSARPPHRWQPLASAEHRIHMVKLAIQDTPGFALDDREYLREGRSYTVETLESIRQQQPDLGPMVMILGMDAFQSFTQWHEWQKILTLTHLVISTRPGFTLDKLHPELEQRLTTSLLDLHKKPSGCILFHPVTQLDISATYIRKQLLEEKSSRFLLPEKVIEYIHQHKLYLKP